MKKKLQINNVEIEVDVIRIGDDSVEFILENQQFSFKCISQGRGKVVLEDNTGARHGVFACGNQTDGHVAVGHRNYSLQTVHHSVKKKQMELGDMISPMPGKILKILVSLGQELQSGETVVIMEAMKMEHSIKAPRDGKVAKIFCKEGELVEGNKELVILASTDKES